MIEFKAVSKFYKHIQALKSVSFKIEPGRNLAFVGPSGCGKSTALRLMAGIDLPTKGEITLDGKTASESTKLLIQPHERKISMVFQDLGLWPNLTVVKNVELGLYQKKSNERHDFAIATLELCGIKNLANRQISEISGGQQQRVALARALAPHPRFLLFDEPFSGLDLVTKTYLFSEIKQLIGSQDITLVLVTHDPWEATVLCQDVIVMNQGMIEESGELKEVLKNPKSELLKVYKSYIASESQ